MSLLVQAPRLASRGGLPPQFAVRDTLGRFVAVDVAASPDALGVPGGGIAAWSSWSVSPLTPPGQIALPATAWAELSKSERVFYRAHSSASPTAWVDHQTTTRDGDRVSAPFVRLCDAWFLSLFAPDEVSQRQLLDLSAQHPDFAELDGGSSLSCLVCLHRFSPKRPVPAASLEWVSVLVCRSSRAGFVDTLVQRFRFDTLQRIEDKFSHDAGDLMMTAPWRPIAPPVPSATFDVDIASWPVQILGPFRLYAEPSPAPDSSGGTSVIIAGIEKCAYLAETSWSEVRTTVHLP